VTQVESAIWLAAQQREIAHDARDVRADSARQPKPLVESKKPSSLARLNQPDDKQTEKDAITPDNKERRFTGPHAAPRYLPARDNTQEEVKDDDELHAGRQGPNKR
jgi:hypothetical protein